MRGTSPAGAQNEQEAARWVRGMFGRVAHRYDLANHLLSFQIDRYWRAHTVRRVSHILADPQARVLDLCCGTGDVMLALERACRKPVFGSDFCHPMLVAARRKLEQSVHCSPLFEADALELPLRDETFDMLTVAFGFRNLANYDAGLREMLRVLRPGGTAAILEFTSPPNAAFAALYHFYSRRILPLIGAALTGDSTAYRYLPESVKKFPGAKELAEEMRKAGFQWVEYEYLTGGIVALHLAVK
jgi:demethylmenaquinone methyltransferase / 2-methoxy-6-polyprenyl-1,4-benzoquinol methylase